MTNSDPIRCIACDSQLDVSHARMFHHAVASDCRPLTATFHVTACPNCGLIQKLLSEDYRSQVAALYQSYQAYELTNGDEQLSFSADVPASRCDQILKNVASYLPEHATRFLDVGTGSGVMLDAIHRQYVEGELYAQDVSDHQHEALAQKLPLKAFFSDNLADISQQFDVITLIHVLEHIDDPGAFLQQLAARLSSDGVAVIQVPDVEANIWDMAIYDHVSHFNRQLLVALAARYFHCVILSQDQLFKEITLVVSQPRDLADETQPLATQKLPLNGVSLIKTFSALSDIDAREPFWVLGTGPAAGYLAAIYPGVCGFIDEDERKWGKQFCDKPVLSLPQLLAQDDAPSIALPYPEQQRDAIKERLMMQSSSIIII